jgi:hypothetical protein
VSSFPVLKCPEFESDLTSASSVQFKCVAPTHTTLHEFISGRPVNQRGMQFTDGSGTCGCAADCLCDTQFVSAGNSAVCKAASNLEYFWCIPNRNASWDCVTLVNGGFKLSNYN